MQMRRAVVCAAVAAWGAGVGADTCASVAATTSIQIKKQFDIGYNEEQMNYWSEFFLIECNLTVCSWA
jgi:hypothetical protein